MKFEQLIYVVTKNVNNSSAGFINESVYCNHLFEYTTHGSGTVEEREIPFLRAGSHVLLILMEFLFCKQVSYGNSVGPFFN